MIGEVEASTVLPFRRSEPLQPGLAIHTLLLTDLVDSTGWVARLGDRRAAEISARHDRLARDLLQQHRGQEIDKTDGFFFLFQRPVDAVAFGLAYHRCLLTLSDELGMGLEARVGIHVGELYLRRNPPEDVARGAKPLEAEGLAKPTAARLMALAEGRQTLLSRGAFDLARRAAQDGLELQGELRWLAHGPFRFQGVEEPTDVFEVGLEGEAPLTAPRDGGKARRVSGDETILGWRPAVGQEIPQRPHWVLCEKIGEGGFGDLWLAEHRKTGEKHALKFCYRTDRLRSLQHEVTIFRLLKETLGARPDIARILDWNFDEAPYFLESEYTEGGNLAEWAEQQGGLAQVPMATRLEIVAQVAEALAAAHSVGVLHKDVKPSNILMTTGRDGAPQPRLNDFGIGMISDQSQLRERGITLLALTSEGDSISAGTPLYMAPEILEGQPASVQADIYALGVILYQMVVGDLGRVLASGWERDIEDELLRGDIGRMVDRSPEHRESSALRVAGGLRRLEERRTKLAAERRRRREAEAAEKALALARRRRRTATLAAVILGLFTAVMAVQTLRTARANKEARAVSDFLVSLFDEADPRIGSTRELTVRKLLQIGAEKIQTEFRDQPLARARLLHHIGTSMRDVEQALPLLEEALQTRRQRLSARHLDIAESMTALAGAYSLLGRAEEGEALLRDSLKIYQSKQLPVDHPGLLGTLDVLAWVRAHQGDFQEREAIYSRVVDIRRQAVGTEHPDYAAALYRLGFALFEAGRWQEAEELYLEARAVYETTLLAKDYRLGETLMGLGHLLTFQGRYPEGRAYFEQARENWEQAFDREDYLIGWCHHGLAEVALGLGELDLAGHHLSEAQRLLEGSIYQGLVWTARGKWHLLRGENESAEQLLQEGLAAGVVADKGALNRILFGDVLRLRGAHEEAAEELRLGTEKAMSLGEEHPVLVWAWNRQAALEADLGHSAEARRLYRQAMDLGAQRLDARHPELARGYLGLAALARREGRLTEAREHLEALAAGLEGPSTHPVWARAAELSESLSQTGSGGS